MLPRARAPSSYSHTHLVRARLVPARAGAPTQTQLCASVRRTAEVALGYMHGRTWRAHARARTARMHLCVYGRRSVSMPSPSSAAHLARDCHRAFASLSEAHATSPFPLKQASARACLSPQKIACAQAASHTSSKCACVYMRPRPPPQQVRVRVRAVRVRVRACPPPPQQRTNLHVARFERVEDAAQIDSLERTCDARLTRRLTRARARPLRRSRTGGRRGVRACTRAYGSAATRCGGAACACCIGNACTGACAHHVGSRASGWTSCGCLLADARRLRMRRARTERFQPVHAPEGIGHAHVVRTSRDAVQIDGACPVALAAIAAGATVTLAD
eukprot:6214344-Pleurochrysis_carterae.AAC.1